METGDGGGDGWGEGEKYGERQKTVHEQKQISKVFNKMYLFIFRQREREVEINGEKHQCVVVSCTLLGAWRATQACTLTGN